MRHRNDRGIPRRRRRRGERILDVVEHRRPGLQRRPRVGGRPVGGGDRLDRHRAVLDVRTLRLRCCGGDHDGRTRRAVGRVDQLVGRSVGTRPGAPPRGVVAPSTSLMPSTGVPSTRNRHGNPNTTPSGPPASRGDDRSGRPPWSVDVLPPEPLGPERAAVPLGEDRGGSRPSGRSRPSTSSNSTSDGMASSSSIRRRLARAKTDGCAPETIASNRVRSASASMRRRDNAIGSGRRPQTRWSNRQDQPVAELAERGERRVGRVAVRPGEDVRCPCRASP